MDKTEPRNWLIAFYAILAVATLAMLKPAFDAYYGQMFEAARADRLATYDDLAEREDVEREWARDLQGGRTSIGDAIEQLGQRGRMAVPQIAPRADAEMNTDPLTGWTHLPESAATTGAEPVDEALEADTVEAAGGAEPSVEDGEVPPGAERDALIAPGQDPGTEAPGGDAARGQPGAGGARQPADVRRAAQEGRARGAGAPPASAEQPSPSPAADPNDSETE